FSEFVFLSIELPPTFFRLIKLSLVKAKFEISNGGTVTRTRISSLSNQFQTRSMDGNQSERTIRGQLHRRDRSADFQSTFHGFLRTCARINGSFPDSKDHGEGTLGVVRRPVGSTVPDHGQLQQDGEAARLRRAQPLGSLEIIPASRHSARSAFFMQQKRGRLESRPK